METEKMLNAHDRCDQGFCGARAANLWTTDTGDRLAFCGHHSRLHSANLTAQGFTVVYSTGDQLASV